MSFILTVRRCAFNLLLLTTAFTRVLANPLKKSWIWGHLK